MFISTISCGGKCCTELGLPLSVCQNDGWREQEAVIVHNDTLCRRFISNPITDAIVFGGLEPFEQISEIIGFIATLRDQFRCYADVVIYTGYYPGEIQSELEALRGFPNIIVKFGRFIPDRPPRYDEVLGVTLVSDNQFAERIS